MEVFSFIIRMKYGDYEFIQSIQFRISTDFWLNTVKCQNSSISNNSV